MRPARIALLIAALGATQAQAGLFDDEEARRQITDHRIKTEARVDQLGKSQLDLANQLQRQSEEYRKQRNIPLRRVDQQNYKEAQGEANGDYPL